MTTTKRLKFGDLSPRYGFILNPYPDERLSRCPMCEQKSGQRKLPLLIHVDPMHLIALNYTCRYCSDCDLLIAHKHEIEHLLTEMFRERSPDVVGNEYLILGTVEKRAWRKGVEQPQTIDELCAHTSDFATYYSELRMLQQGWYPKGKKPPIMEPPSSREWVKTRRRFHSR